MSNRAFFSARGPAQATWAGSAPAKVNFFLRILAREEGGHHQIETLFQALELSDRVDVRVFRTGAGPGEGAGQPPGARVSLELEGVEDGALGPPDTNLAVRAARAFLEAAGFDGPGGPPSVEIRLEKRIPHGAGLGGGSSDAAAVLRALAALFPEALSPERLQAIAGSLGADVPFFLGGGALALGWGRGDRILPLPALPSRPVILLVPEPPVSTPWAYQVLAAHREAAGESAAPACILPPDLLRSASTRAGGSAEGGTASAQPPEGARWDALVELAENAFQPALEPHRPELALMRRALVEEGAAPALLSGSGSALFGVFPDSDAAERAYAELARRFPGVRRIRSRTLGPPGSGED